MLKHFYFYSISTLFFLSISGICCGHTSDFMRMRYEGIRVINVSDALVDASIDVSGVVTDTDGEPLIGVNIHIKGSAEGTATDIDGYYELKDVEEGAILVFTYIGYKSIEMEVGDQSVMNVQMTSDAQMLDEVVVVGYGTLKKKDLTGSVSSIKAEDFETQSMSQMTEMLSGTIAGFNSDQGTGAAGGGSMQVRGPKSLNANANPMIVVDGAIFNGSLADINPSDIETVDILKDASSSAVFGARAAAGVILVTTKRGKVGEPKISVSSSISSVGLTHSFKPYDNEGYLGWRADVLRQYYPNNEPWYYNNPDNLPDGVTLDQWRNASNNPQSDNTREWLKRLNFFDIETNNYMNGEYIDWYNEVMQRGSKQNHDLSISGGTEKIRYYWSIGYQNNTGVILGDKYSSIRSRLNLEADITSWLKVGTNTQFSQRQEDAVLASLGQMFNMSPYGSMYEENGDLKWYPNDFATANPLIDYYGRDRFQRSNNLFSMIFSEIRLPLDIQYKISFQPRIQFSKDYNFYNSKTLAGGADRSGGYGVRSESSVSEWILDHLFSWNKRIDVHNVDLTFLYSAERNEGWSSSMNNQSFIPNENLNYHGLQYGIKPALTTDDSKVTGDALMGRLNYSFDNRYLLTLSLRRDGYSAFGTKHPTAWFPAAAVGWVMSEENFFNKDLISFFKIRATWGVNGNRDIGAYAALAQLSAVPYYDGSSSQVGITPTRLGNEDLKWEKTESLNFGIDVNMFHDRITGSLDVYDMTTNDLLMNRLLPRITGYSNVVSNLGELGNRGMEFSIGVLAIDKGDFQWNSNFNFSFNRNKIKKLFGDFEEYQEDGVVKMREVPDYSNKWFPGEAIDRIWDYNLIGIWQNEEADEAAKYGLKPGDFKAEDPNGDYKFTAIEDKQFIGYSAPRFRLGFGNDFTIMKDITVSMFWRADLGHMGTFSEGKRPSGADTYDRRNTYDFPYWTVENQNNLYPRLVNNYTVFGGGIDMYFSRSFVRLQDLSVAYEIPNHIIDRFSIARFKLYIASRNLLTFHKWPKWDPESPNNPMPKTFTLGLHLSI